MLGKQADQEVLGWKMAAAWLERDTRPQPGNATGTSTGHRVLGSALGSLPAPLWASAPDLGGPPSRAHTRGEAWNGCVGREAPTVLGGGV